MVITCELVSPSSRIFRITSVSAREDSDGVCAVTAVAPHASKPIANLGRIFNETERVWKPGTSEKNAFICLA